MNKMYCLLLATLILESFMCSIIATELKVNGDHVILRSAPNENSEVVTQVLDGDILVTDKDIDGKWIEVIPPEKVSFWVYGELIRDNVVAVSKVQVRIGPGINYKSIGEIAKDYKVTVRGEYREWLKISPPSSCRLWVNRKSVDPVDKAVPAEANNLSLGKPVIRDKPVESTESLTVSVKPVAKTPALKTHVENTGVISNKKSSVLQRSPQISAERLAPDTPLSSIRDSLVSSKEQGRIVQFTGILRRSVFFVWRQPSKYRLVVHDNNGVAVTVCYVMGDEKQLTAMQDKSVIIHGKEYWIQGVRQSVVMFEKILQKNY